MTQTADVCTPQAPPSRAGTLSRLYATALYLWIGAAGAALAGFVFWAVVARFYDAHEVGLASAALAALTLLSLFSPLGLGLGLIRFLPESGERGPHLVNAVLASSATLALISSVVFLLGIPLWTPSLGFLREQPLYALAFVSFTVLATLSGVQTQALMATRRARFILIQVAFIQLGRLAVPALLAAFFGAFGIILSVGAALTIGTAVGFFLLSRALADYRPALTIDVRAVRKLLPFSAGNYLADLLMLAPGLLLPILVVSLLGSEEGGHFYIAWFLGYLLTSASAYLGLSLFAEGSHDPGSLLALSRNALAGALTVALAGAMFLVLLGDKLLLVFGSEYASEGATLLRIVAMAAVPAAIVNVYLGALRVARRIGELVTIAGLVAATTVGMSYALLSVMGLEGAGIGLVIGQSLGLVIVLGNLITSIQGTATERFRRLSSALVPSSPGARAGPDILAMVDERALQGTEPGEVNKP